MKDFEIPGDHSRNSLTSAILPSKSAAHFGRRLALLPSGSDGVEMEALKSFRPIAIDEIFASRNDWWNTAIAAKSTE
jgi:hypothetical protein